MSTSKPKRTKPKPILTLADQLRAAISDSGVSPYRVSQNAGVRPEVVTRFLNGGRDIYLETAGKIAQVLGYSLEKTHEATVTKRERGKTAPED